jgi:hypothetical protein
MPKSAALWLTTKNGWGTIGPQKLSLKFSGSAMEKLTHANIGAASTLLNLSTNDYWRMQNPEATRSCTQR